MAGNEGFVAPTLGLAWRSSTAPGSLEKPNNRQVDTSPDRRRFVLAGDVSHLRTGPARNRGAYAPLISCGGSPCANDDGLRAGLRGSRPPQRT